MIEGLTDCRVFLKDKYINEVFYEGVYRGHPCIVKCSGKCAWSIGNEHALASRIFAEAPEIVEEPLAYGEDFGAGPDGVLPSRRRAYIVTAKISGPSLAILRAQGLSASRADAFADDISLLARTLRRTGILHRDLYEENLLLGADGHLKAIDWQLAIDRNAYREDPWVARHWKFRYVVFGVNRELGMGVWNDFHALGKILEGFPQTSRVRAVRSELKAEEAKMAFSAPPSRLDRFRLWCYGWSLRAQMLLRGRRHRKYVQLERRWQTVTGRCKEKGRGV